MARTLADLADAGLIDAGWASALAPVAPDIAALGDRLRAEVAAGRALSAGRRSRAACLPAAARRREGAHRGPRPVSDSRSSDRPVVRCREARASPAPKPVEHLPGAERGPRPSPAHARRPLGVERPGRHAAEQGADGARREHRHRIAVGAGRRSPSTRSASWSPATARSSRSCGDGMLRTCGRCSDPPRSSNPPTRRRSRRAGASSDRGRSRVRTRCSRSRARRLSIWRLPV